MATETLEPRCTRPSRHLTLLWLELLAGPIAWAVDLTLGYMLVPHARSSGHKISLLLVAIVTLIGALAGAIGSWRMNRRLAEDAPPGQRFMTIGGIALGAFFAAVIVAEALPVLLLHVED